VLEEKLKNFKDVSKIEDPQQLICQRFTLSPPAKEIIEQSSNSLIFLKNLITAELYPDAVHFLAHGLPKREAIWWAYLCADTCILDEYQILSTEVLDLIKMWIYSPKEETRRKIEPFPEKLHFQSPASWVALAVFWSGGSITAKDTPVVLPADYLYAKGVSGSVMLSAVHIPSEINKRYQQFLERGILIAEGKSGLI